MKFQNIIPLLADQQGTTSIKFLRAVSGIYIVLSMIAGIIGIAMIFRGAGVIQIVELLAAVLLLLQGLIIGGGGLCLATISENILAKRVMAQSLADHDDKD